MKIIVTGNNKGGVGKTKCSTIIAEYCSRLLNKPTLAIDFDPQCNFSPNYLHMEIDPNYPEGNVPPVHPHYDPSAPDNDPLWDGRSSSADIFFSGGTEPYPTYIQNLDILPGHAYNLLLAERVRKNEMVEKVTNRLHQFLSLKEVQDIYEAVIIDTPPSKGPLTIAAIKAASHLIVPSVMEERPIDGVYGMLQLWMQESSQRETNRKLELVGILANKYDARSSLHKSIYDELKAGESTGKYLLEQKLHQRMIYAEIDSQSSICKSIFDLPDNHVAKQEVIKVCEEIAKRIFKDG